MKQLLLAFLIFGASPVFGDDMALAKATFEKFDQLQKANDLKATTLLSEDCEGKLIQSDGEMEIAVDVPKGQFAKFIELAVQEEKKKKDLYEDVEFAASGDAIEASGFIRYADPAFRGPFAMEFGKNPAGEMKITFMTITVPLLSTPIKSEGSFRVRDAREVEPRSNQEERPWGGQSLSNGECRRTGNKPGLLRLR